MVDTAYSGQRSLAASLRTCRNLSAVAVVHPFSTLRIKTKESYMKEPIQGGYIYVAKSLLDSEIWFCSANTVKVGLYLLLSASFSDDDKKNLTRGQCWKTIGIISEDCNISTKAVRCALDRLRSIQFIETLGAHRGARSGQRITICNYSKFQDVHNYKGAGQGNGLGHAKGQAEGQHYNEENEENEVLDFKKLSNDDFKKLTWEHGQKQYSVEMLKAFYDYWTEPDNKGKSRFKLNKTWCTSRRLNTWSKNNFNKPDQKDDLDDMPDYKPVERPNELPLQFRGDVK